ncbi:hypothetical protein [Streptomyces bohaiensis]|uniref:hypothetical protein n=1 Tax=Streptomyces bohaiensis TaxID=1431344 RepID=UPI003B7744D2
MQQRLVTRAELTELGRGSDSALYLLWRDRAQNGHPEPVVTTEPYRWDLGEWDSWHRALLIEQAREGVDLTGDPQELLKPAQQARLLGITTSTLSHYSKRPPRFWPAPAATEELPSGRVRELRTRQQLWDWVDLRAVNPDVGVRGPKPK